MFIYQKAKRDLRPTGRRIVDVATMNAITINYLFLNRLAKSLKKVDLSLLRVVRISSGSVILCQKCYHQISFRCSQ